jgi:hypothetical protein
MQASGGTRQSRDASATLSGSPNGVRCRFSQEQRVRGQHTRPPAACFARVRATGTGVVVLASSRPVAPLGNDLRTTTIRSVGGSPRNLDAHARGPSTTTPDYTTGLPRRAEPRRRIVVFLPRRGPAAGLRCLRLIAAGKFSGSGCNTPQQGRLERAQRFLQLRAAASAPAGEAASGTASGEVWAREVGFGSTAHLPREVAGGRSGRLRARARRS